MNWSIFATGMVSGLLITAVVLELIRRKSLKERYALLWLLLVAVLILLSAWPGLLQRIARLLDIYYPPSIIFGLAFLFVFAVMIHFSVVLSRQSRGYNRMVQRLSILEERIQRLNREETREVAGPEDGEADNGESVEGG